MDIKLVLTDIDGVWTDGGMYYDEHENEFKKFNTSDSGGVILLREMNIPVGIISGENTNIVRRRANKLKIEIVRLGIQQKLAAFDEISKQLNIPYENIAYIGDDVVDIPVLKVAGLSAVPAGVPDYISTHASWQMKKRGGEGVFREFAEKILISMGLFDKALAQLLARVSNRI